MLLRSIERASLPLEREAMSSVQTVPLAAADGAIDDEGPDWRVFG
jgi:hypothetical protein